MITVKEIMGYEPCYSEKRILDLWAGRESLSPKEIAELYIPDYDKTWALCQCLAHRDLGALTKFIEGCEARARAAVVVAATAAAAARASEVATKMEVEAAEARARAARAWASRASSWQTSWAMDLEERQTQLDELVAALEKLQ